MAQNKKQITTHPDQSQTDYYYREDEISLTDFLEILVNQKMIVVISTSLFTILSILYVQWLTPTYLAKIGFREPQETFMSVLPPKVTQDLPHAVIKDHTGRVIRDEVSPFMMYLEQLESYALQQQVFEDGNFLKKFHGDNVTIDIKNAVLSVHSSMNFTREEADETLSFLQKPVYLEMSGSKPDVMSEFLGALHIKAKEHVIKEIKNSVSLMIDNEIAEISRNIDLLSITNKTDMAKNILSYSEALEISKKLGIKNNNFDKVKNVSSVPMWYLYGENALQQELVAIKKRTSENIIPGVSEARISLSKYKSIDLSSLKINVAVITQPSSPPTSPIQPRNRMIISVGMALGLSIGIFIGFVRNSMALLKKRRMASTSA